MFRFTRLSDTPLTDNCSWCAVSKNNRRCKVDLGSPLPPPLPPPLSPPPARLTTLTPPVCLFVKVPSLCLPIFRLSIFIRDAIRYHISELHVFVRIKKYITISIVLIWIDVLFSLFWYPYVYNAFVDMVKFTCNFS